MNPSELMWLKERVSTGSHIRQICTTVELYRLKDIQRLMIPPFLVFLPLILKKVFKKLSKKHCRLGFGYPLYLASKVLTMSFRALYNLTCTQCRLQDQFSILSLPGAAVPPGPHAHLGGGFFSLPRLVVFDRAHPI